MQRFDVQHLMEDWHGYEGWDTFCIRDAKTNCHVATVGHMDRHNSERYGEYAYKMAASPQLYDALRLCFTRLFNYQAGIDDIRNPEATRQLNQEALGAAKAALYAAGGYHGKR